MPIIQSLSTQLLSLNMSDAAAHYGVRADVVPKRTRVTRGSETNA